MIEKFSHFFKPEVQNAADDLISAGAVYLKIGSDTQIDASIKSSTPVQVSFRSSSIESADFSVDCSCKASKKGQLCKHIWATLIVATKKSPDFFEEKSLINKVDLFAAATAAKVAKQSPEAAQRQIDFQQKQADYRKQAYQKQKARAKEMKSARDDSKTRSGGGQAAKPSKFAVAIPDDAKPALAYFEANGFSFTLPIDEVALSSAKRVLSRVFHPDKGGSQDEMLELLKNAAILMKHR